MSTVQGNAQVWFEQDVPLVAGPSRVWRARLVGGLVVVVLLAAAALLLFRAGVARGQVSGAAAATAEQTRCVEAGKVWLMDDPARPQCVRHGVLTALLLP